MKEFVQKLLKSISFGQPHYKNSQETVGFKSSTDYIDFKKSFLPYIVVILLLIGVGVTVYQVQKQQNTRGRAAATNPPFPSSSKVLFGMAVDPDLFSDARYTDILKNRGVRIITPENVMKMSYTQPARGSYDFTQADKVVDFATANNLKVYGHVLVWHEQIPAWFGDAPTQTSNLTKDEIRSIMQDRVQTLMGRYKGKTIYWDVFSEAIDMTQPDGWRNTIFKKKFGAEYEGFIKQIFLWARAADPQAKLYWDDFCVEDVGPKSDFLYQKVQAWRIEGVPIDGISFQAHSCSTANEFTVKQTLDTNRMFNNILRFSNLGLETNFTQLDIQTFDYPGSFDNLQKQTDLYKLYASLCVQIPGCTKFIVWGVHDGHTWRNSWWLPNAPKIDAPTLFDENFAPKPAFFSTLEGLGYLGTDIRIIAAGSVVRSEKPKAEVYINNEKVYLFATSADPNSGGRDIFTFRYPYPLNNSVIRINFVNDQFFSASEDRNLFVDRLEIDGIRYETEDPSTYSVGSYTPATACNPGYKQNEWLNCPGYFEYRLITANFIYPTATPIPVPPTPTPTPTPIPNRAPFGAVDGQPVSNCTEIIGWTCDPDDFTKTIDVHLYKDALTYPQNFLGAYPANVFHDPGATAVCGGQPNHGFRIPFPASLKDGIQHTILAYGINYPNDGNNPNIGSVTLMCAVPPTGTVSASPNPCNISFGQSFCSTVITAQYTNASSAEICVSTDGSNGNSFFGVAPNTPSSATAPWIQAGLPYTFTLRTPVGSCTGTSLASVVVTANPPPPTPLPPTPTFTPMPTPTRTPTPIPAAPTFTPTPTRTPTPTIQPTNTPTPTITPTPTPILISVLTNTPVPTFNPTSTPFVQTPTPIPTASFIPTATYTPFYPTITPFLPTPSPSPAPPITSAIPEAGAGIGLLILLVGLLFARLKKSL